MEMDRNVLSRIKEILKTSPRGMNVTEIVGEIKMNRQSVSKYLEMLVMSGHVDVRTFGPSKVYYLSQRLPISAMLSLSYDFIVILDRMLNIINVNDRFLAFTGTRREDLMYKNLENFAFPLEFEPSILPNVKDALRGEESAIEAQYRKRGKESYFNIKFIPMVLDDGDKGITIIIEDITEKKQIVNAIKESEDKFRSIIEQSLDGIVLIDERGVIVESNEGLQRITGYDRDGMLGKRLWDLPFMTAIAGDIAPASVNQFEHVLKAFLSRREGSTQRSIYEYEVRRQDGTTIITQTAAFKIRTNKGNLLCAIVRDVTEKKRAEVELRKAHQELDARVKERTMELEIANKALTEEINRRTLLDQALGESQRTLSTLISNLPGIVYRRRNDELGTVDFISAGCRDITGYEPRDFIGDHEISYEGIIHPDDRKPVRDQIQAALIRREPFRITYRIIAASGAVRWAFDQGSGVFSPGGDLIDIEGYITDITDVRDLMQARKTSHDRHFNHLERVTDSIWETDADLKFVCVSPSIQDILGMTPEDVIGRTPFDLMAPADAVRFRGLMQPNGEPLKSFSFYECLLKHKDSTIIPANISGCPIFDEGGEFHGHRGIIRNLSLRKRPGN